MSELYNYEYYHNCCGPIAYEEPAHWVEFFGNVADRIAKDLHPQTVLDAGCAMGYLVAALRDCGVEAYGIDISEYAISKVREDIRPYCVVGSLTEPLPEGLPKRYDLVVTIEVLEHLYAEDGRKAIHNLCALTDRIIFSSTPDDFTESTHVNVQQREYWARIFAEEGFFDNINYRPTYLTYHACCFQKKVDWLRQLEDYERNIRMTEAQQRTDQQNYNKAIEDKERHIQNQNSIIAQCEEENKSVKSDYEAALKEYDTAKQDLKIQLETAAQEYEDAKRCYEEKLENAVQNLEMEKSSSRAQLEAFAQEFDKEKLDYEAQIQTITRTYEGQLREADEKYKALESKYHERFNENKQIQKLIRISFKLQLEEIEKNLRKTEKIVAAAQSNSLLEAQRNAVNQELAHYKEHYLAAINQREQLKAELCQTQNALAVTKKNLLQAQTAYNVISNATFWKITKPFRFTLDCIKAVLGKSRHLRLVGKGLRCWKENGFTYTCNKIKGYFRQHEDAAKVALSAYAEENLEAQRYTDFPRKIKFSIVVPLYNTPDNFLREMIQSVLDQTYADWELCMADGSDQEHGNVEKICRKYAQEDERILYQKLGENRGISGNSNAALKMISGEYIALLDHDDVLHPAALYNVMQAICGQNSDMIYTDEASFRSPDIHNIVIAHFKQDFAPDTLRSYNYICHFTVFSNKLLKKIGGGFRSEFDGSQDYDLVLRLTEQAQKITHIPKMLYFWRIHPGSVASATSSKNYAISAAKRALAEHLNRLNLKGDVKDSIILSNYRMTYEIQGKPLVSILIPNKDHCDDLQKCIQSIKEKTTYENWEIVIVENNSIESKTFDLYYELEKDPRIHVVFWKGKFNYSAINNWGARTTKGEYLLLLNNDIEVITPDWIEQMLMFCQRQDVGAAGCMLYYPDNTIQHAGVIVGLGGVAGHSHKYFPRGSAGYMSRLTIAHNLSAVTGACMMIRRDVWDQVKGLDEGFEVAFNDVDLCMRIRKAGYLIVWTPYAELYHHESKSRGSEDTLEKQKRFQGEVKRFQTRWKKELAEGDPYYNPNLTLSREDFSLRLSDPDENIEVIWEECDVHADEENLMYSVDSTAIAKNGNLSIKGWLFQENQRSEDVTPVIYLQDQETGKYFRTNVIKQYRPDLSVVFPNGSLYEDAGFHAITSIEKMEKPLASYQLILGLKFKNDTEKIVYTDYQWPKID